MIDADVRFSIVPEWVSDHEQGGFSHLAVRLFSILARYANSEGGGIIPSRTTLARRMGLAGPDRVDVAKAELVDGGALAVTARFEQGTGRQLPNEYRLIFTPPATLGRAEETRPGEGRVNAPGGSRGNSAQTRTTEREDVPTATPSGRAPDQLWDALVEAMGVAAPITRSGRGAWNRARLELRDAGATPELIVKAAANYRRQWPNVELTPTALAKHWHVFALEADGATAIAIAEAWARNVGVHLPDAAREEKLADYAVKGLRDEQLDGLRRMMTDLSPLGVAA